MTRPQTSNKKPSSDIQVFRQSALAQPSSIRRIVNLPPAISAIERSFPGDLSDPDRARKAQALIEQAQTHIASSQAAEVLLRCTGESFVQALTDCAALDLSLHKALGEAYLVPFAACCTLMPGYRGLITLMVRTGAVASVDVQAVYEGEEFRPFAGTEPRIVHEQRLDIPRDYKHLVGVYMVARNIQGPPTVELMNLADIERVRKASKAVQSGKKGPWDFWPEEMAKKSVIRRGQKKFPKRGDDKAWELLARAAEMDNRQFDLLREQAATAQREHGKVLREQAEAAIQSASVPAQADGAPPAAPVTPGEKRALLADVEAWLGDKPEPLPAAELIRAALCDLYTGKPRDNPKIETPAELAAVREAILGGAYDPATGDRIPAPEAPAE
jgi:phage RecT family recombinase